MKFSRLLSGESEQAPLENLNAPPFEHSTINCLKPCSISPAGGLDHRLSAGTLEPPLSTSVLEPPPSMTGFQTFGHFETDSHQQSTPYVSKLSDITRMSSDKQSVPAAPNDKYILIKALVSDPSLFRQQPVIEVGQESILPEDDFGDSNWADFQSSITATVSDFNCDNAQTLPMATTNWNPPKDEIFGDVGESKTRDVDWASFQTCSLDDQMVLNSVHTQPEPSWNKNSVQTASKTPDSKALRKPQDKTYNFFHLNEVKGPPVGIGISPLDFHPPELPDDDEELDDFPPYQMGKKSSNNGISSLGAPYIDDDETISPADEKNFSSSVFGSYRPSAAATPTAAGSRGMTQSSSSNSLEFTGWKLSLISERTEPDAQSANSLDLKNLKVDELPDDSPQDADSQSISSLDFPTMESELKSATDEQSVASLELKQTSPDDNVSQKSSDLSTNKMAVGEKQSPSDVIPEFGSSFQIKGKYDLNLLNFGIVLRRYIKA